MVFFRDTDVVRREKEGSVPSCVQTVTRVRWTPFGSDRSAIAVGFNLHRLTPASSRLKIVLLAQLAKASFTTKSKSLSAFKFAPFSGLPDILECIRHVFNDYSTTVVVKIDTMRARLLIIERVEKGWNPCCWRDSQ